MPTIEELDTVALLTSSIHFNRLSTNDARREVMQLAIDAKRNAILADILMVIDK